MPWVTARSLGAAGVAGYVAGVPAPDPSIVLPSPAGPRPDAPSWERAPTTLLRAAVRPRMLVLLVVLLVAAAGCARLGVWQLDRAVQRGEQVARHQSAAQQAARPEGIGDVLAPQQSFRSELVGRTAQVTGTYEAGGQLLVSGRVLGGRTGFLVLTPLRVTNAAGTAGWSGEAPVLPVVRGWVADAAQADLLAVPAGTMTVTGYLQVSEGSGSKGAGGVPTGQTDAISSAELVNSWRGPIYSGYLVLAETDPQQSAGLVLLGPPTLGTEGGGTWNLQNLSYAVQWWLFAAFAVGLWIRLVRDEAAGDPGFTTSTAGAAAP